MRLSPTFGAALFASAFVGNIDAIGRFELKHVLDNDGNAVVTIEEASFGTTLNGVLQYQRSEDEGLPLVEVYGTTGLTINSCIDGTLLSNDIATIDTTCNSQTINDGAGEIINDGVVSTCLNFVVDQEASTYLSEARLDTYDC